MLTQPLRHRCTDGELCFCRQWWRHCLGGDIETVPCGTLSSLQDPKGTPPWLGALTCSHSRGDIKNFLATSGVERTRRGSVGTGQYSKSSHLLPSPQRYPVLALWSHTCHNSFTRSSPAPDSGRAPDRQRSLQLLAFFQLEHSKFCHMFSLCFY